MFKKHPDPKASANIKSSERRKLLSNICNLYSIPQHQISRETEQRILPLTTKQATFKSPQGYSGTIYYNENETPTWFKSRDSQIYPSLFTLWNAPFLLPTIKTHPHVIQILSGGADLMLPGTIPPFDDRAVKGSIVGIVDSKNPTVIKAVGRCKLNMTQFDNVIGRTGIAVEVLHSIGDGLYDLNKLVDIEVPEELDTDIPIEEKEQEENEHDSGEVQVGETQVEPEVEEVQEAPSSADNDDSDLAEKLAELSVDQVDNFFKRAMIQAIKLDTIELPISSSNFMSNHVLKNLPPISPELCNIKKTSWKKTIKFLKAMEKSKYIVTRKKGEDVVIDNLMDKSNPEIVEFITHKVASNAVNSKPTPSKKDKSNEFQVVNLYKPTNNSRIFFNKVDADYNKLYKSPELKVLLEKYIKLQDLPHKKQPKNIVLDDTLNTATKLGLGVYPRDKVSKSFIDHLSPFHVILKPGETSTEGLENSRFTKGSPPKISIITDMKIGRKIVTKVTHFEQFYIKPHILADELKVKCSGSATIAPCIQNPNLIEVTVQGPHGKLITEMFQQKGIPSSFIEFQDNVKSKKKRK
ncbi:translation machinery-associated protein 64 [[Candida] railenensis]|uniref:Translation machinery-associated protein 64 n=1 Tax=[Candida] railenensis TaxID=45579 RepID=A0A9P0VWT1_9ASCO|nr:translation machinery-associated protein 64 [[Candida] railenensis]